MTGHAKTNRNKWDVAVHGLAFRSYVPFDLALPRSQKISIWKEIGIGP
jgi:hypothetical protein